MIKLFPQLKTIWDEYRLALNSINAIEKDLIQLSDSELKSKTLKLKDCNFKQDSLDNRMLYESFALTREAAKRTINLR